MGKKGRILKNGNNQDVYSVIGNRLPPHSPDAEMAVLGSMLLDNAAIIRAVELLSKESFYIQKNQLIFETIVAMFEKGTQVDILTLTEELKKKGQFETIGGEQYLTDLLSIVPTAENVEYYGKIVQEKYIKRALISTAGKIIFNCFDDSGDALEEVDNAEKMIFEIAERRFAKNYLNIKKLIFGAIDSLTHLIESDKKGITGVPTGFIDMDRYLGGFQKSDLIIIAARPSVGKTAFALSIARTVAVDYNIPVGFFSLEMSAQQLTMRLISSQTGINNHKIRTGNINRKELKTIIDKITKLSNAPLYIDDSPRINLLELRAKARRMKTEHKVGLIFVDYLQLIDPPKAESREREISIISRTLKQIAKELDIPIVALSQLNRSVETRANKRPQLSDLRESGSIEQDADVVLFIYRPEIYDIKIWSDTKEPTEGTAEIIIGKQRNGPTGSFRVVYFKDTLRFDNGEFRYLDKDLPPQEAESTEIDDVEDFEEEIDEPAEDW
ncbi:MAG: replicative DNA helicase [Ignavibacteria bacterium]|nr:replicative DNA helicase [Ignavibacteria bacterium]